MPNDDCAPRTVDYNSPSYVIVLLRRSQKNVALILSLRIRRDKRSRSDLLLRINTMVVGGKFLNTTETTRGNV